MQRREPRTVGVSYFYYSSIVVQTKAEQNSFLVFQSWNHLHSFELIVCHDLKFLPPFSCSQLGIYGNWFDLCANAAEYFTLSMVFFEKETLYFLFRIMDTVDWETPAARAISVDVTFFLFIGFVLLSKFGPPFQRTQKRYLVNVF